MTGANGRLGRALIGALGRVGRMPRAWTRPDYDLDDPAAAARMVALDRPGLVIHSAAWTDVDGCAHDPECAMRRNATAVAELSEAVAGAGGSLVLVSTNEVFDGRRTDGQGYREDDAPNPVNPYGQSKLAGELAAQEAFDRAGLPDRLTVVRTAWLYGPPGNDFPTKILAAADRLAPGDALRVVVDEVGSPTFSADLAAGIVELAGRDAGGGIVHLVNGGTASRLDVARAVLKRCRPAVRTEPISRTEFLRASSPPAWAVLDTERARAAGVMMRPWLPALNDYLDALCDPR